MIKMLFWLSVKSAEYLPELTSQQLEHAVKRNFGGLEMEGLQKLRVKIAEHFPDIAISQIENLKGPIDVFRLLVPLRSAEDFIDDTESIPEEVR